MPGFMRPDFPEVTDEKITIGEHRDGLPLRVADIYEVGSLSNEPALHDKILVSAPSVDPDEQKLIEAISSLLTKNSPTPRRQRADEKRTG